ncbi:alpha/beta fold hydrolase [Kribbella sp. NBC_00382]|uniref:PHA/PHB synthase family protein n=1 Tax=Kribbella sp. NBC_00382 TaxID=2975967 RepID=UPI002E228C6B
MTVTKPRSEAPAPGDPTGFGKALVATLSRSATRPAGLAAAALTFAGSMSKLGPATAAVLLANGAGKDTRATDRRFADAAWSSNPAFFALRGVYQAACQWGEDVLAVGSDDPVVEAKAALAGQVLADALAPTNFLLTNPAALRRAAETGGLSLVKGATNFVGDLLTNGGKPRQVDSSSFEVGRNLAATPGKVVFRNDLMELIQYAPQTESVRAVPLLAIPPWINKYYVMDLAPGRSFLEWAVQHERTVFVMSYRNADASMNGVTMDDYLSRGPCAALDVITEITGSSTVDLAGLCIGGAMTAMTAAYLAQSEPDRVGTVTLLNTLLDYRDPGALGVFTDEASVARLEEQMARSGFLDGEKMAGTFDVLRPNQLIFNYVVSNWLLGETPPAFDILVWNADTTRIPATLHSSYLRSLYVDNLLASGQLELGGCRLNLGDVTNDAYVVGAVNDHIVPWTASYEATQLLGGDVRYVLSSGGHIAGIVNPPGPKAWFEAAAENPADAGDWRAAAKQHPGTWWTDWDAWAAERAGPMVAPPDRSVEHPPLCDAPGEYIRS